MAERDWSNATPQPGDTVEADALRARVAEPLGAVLLSGDLAAGIAALAPDAPMLGLGGQVPGDAAFALRIARDRVLLCTPEPLDIAPGWQDGYAASPADDAWLPIMIEGAGAEMIIAAGTGVDADAGSPSCAVGFAGVQVLLLRWGDGFGLFVPRPETAAVWTWLEVTGAALGV